MNSANDQNELPPLEQSWPGARNPLRIDVDRLEPFASEPEWELTFSDMQAVFGTDLHTTRNIIRVLRAAQLLLARVPARGAKPTYLLEKPLIKLLTGRRPERISRAKALACASEAIEAAAAHNGERSLARVIGIEFSGALMDASAATLQCVPVRITVAVTPAGTLVQDVTALLRRLRHVGSGLLRESLVLVAGV